MDDEFPRSFMHCLNAVEESLSTSDNNRPCLLAVRQVIKGLDQTDVQTLDTSTLGALVDRRQRGLMDVHATVSRMYFLAPVEAA